MIERGRTVRRVPKAAAQRRRDVIVGGLYLIAVGVMLGLIIALPFMACVAITERAWQHEMTRHNR